MSETKYEKMLIEKQQSINSELSRLNDIKKENASNNKTGWYEFDQNNSGGSFTTNDKLCHRVWIEASTKNEAISKALDLGIYFDGCSIGNDCSCCGDRWHEPYGEATYYPYNYDKKESLIFVTPEEHAQYVANKFSWTTPDVRLFYKNGKVKEIFSNKKVK